MLKPGDREEEFGEMSSILDLWILQISRRHLALWTDAHSIRPKEVIKICECEIDKEQNL